MMREWIIRTDETLPEAFARVERETVEKCRRLVEQHFPEAAPVLDHMMMPNEEGVPWGE